MHPIMRHPLDRKPELRAFLEQFPLPPTYERSLAEYRRFADTLTAIDHEIKRIDTAINEASRIILHEGRDDPATREAIARYARLSAEREYLPGLQRQVAVRIAHAISDWGRIAGRIVKSEDSRRAVALMDRRAKVKPDRDELKKYGGGDGLPGPQKERYDQLARNIATVEPLEAARKEVARIQAALDKELSDRFHTDQHSSDRGITMFLRRIGLEPGESI